MNNKEREITKAFVMRKISKEEYFRSLSIHEPSLKIKELFESSIELRNPDDIYYLLATASILDLIDDSYVDLFCELLVEDWHFKHEDIARYLQKLKSEKLIKVLYQTVLKKYEYLEHDNSYALARKCIWALGDINTSESIKMLKLLFDSGDSEIQDYVLEQADRNCVNLDLVELSVGTPPSA